MEGARTDVAGFAGVLPRFNESGYQSYCFINSQFLGFYLRVNFHFDICNTPYAAIILYTPHFNYTRHEINLNTLGWKTPPSLEFKDNCSINTKDFGKRRRNLEPLHLMTPSMGVLCLLS